MAEKHPQARHFAAHRAARALKNAPLRQPLRQACSWLAHDPIGATPMPIRRAAFKLYRATRYAEHIS